MDKEYYKEHRKNSFTMWSYAIQRIDLLIVAISGAGIYVVLEALKYSLEHKLQNSLFLKFCGVVFLIALIVNFISQWTGEQANEHEIKFADEKLDDKEDSAKIEASIADKWSGATIVLNITSALSMFLALVLLVTYFFITF